VAAVQLAQTYLAAGRIQEAKQAYQQELRVRPQDANALNDLAFIMAETGDNLDQALAYATRAAQSATDARLKNSISDTLGWIHLKKKSYEQAQQIFQDLVSSNPHDGTFRYHLGVTLYQTGNTRGARTELEAALAAKPTAADGTKIRELLSRL